MMLAKNLSSWQSGYSVKSICVGLFVFHFLSFHCTTPVVYYFHFCATTTKVYLKSRGTDCKISDHFNISHLIQVSLLGIVSFGQEVNLKSKIFRKYQFLQWKNEEEKFLTYRNERFCPQRIVSGESLIQGLSKYIGASMIRETVSPQSTEMYAYFRLFLETGKRINPGVDFPLYYNEVLLAS